MSDFLNEMAMPSQNHIDTVWYHGTSKDYINKIIKDEALKPNAAVTKRTNRMMSPVYDKVYLTAELDEAINYAYFRSKGNTEAYLVIVDGRSLKDIQPDEDVIADLLQTEDTIRGFEWLDRLAKYIDPKLYHKFQIMGDYAYSISLAKKVVKRLNNEQKIELINKGMKIAHSGEIDILQVWELPAAENNYEHKINSGNFYDLGKRIY